MIRQASKRLCGFAIALLILTLGATFVYSEEYRVDTGDILLITVYEHPDLITKTRVNSGGEINFPFIGTVYVKGSTVEEAAEKIKVLLEKDYLVDPQVNVSIERYAPKKVFIMGFVNRPGEYELFKDRITTILEVIAMAGGFKEGAAQNSTKIMRLEDGQELTIPIRVMDITKKGQKDKDIAVKPGDIIVVPESFF